TGNDAEHNRNRVAGLSFRGLCRATHPIAPVAAFRVLWQKMAAIRARYFIACGRFRRSCRRIRVLHVHTYRNSQAAPNSSSKQNSELRAPRITRICSGVLPCSFPLARPSACPFMSLASPRLYCVRRRSLFHIRRTRVIRGQVRFLLFLTLATCATTRSMEDPWGARNRGVSDDLWGARVEAPVPSACVSPWRLTQTPLHFAVWPRFRRLSVTLTAFCAFARWAIGTTR